MDLLPWGRVFVRALKHVSSGVADALQINGVLIPSNRCKGLRVMKVDRRYITNVNHADTSSITAMTRLNRPIATAERQNRAAPRPR